MPWKMSPFTNELDYYKADADIDHGSIGGLTDDDHTQYYHINGSRAITGDLLVQGSGTITGAVSFDDDLLVGGTITTTGSASIGDDLNVLGDTFSVNENGASHGYFRIYQDADYWQFVHWTDNKFYFQYNGNNLFVIESDGDFGAYKNIYANIDQTAAASYIYLYEGTDWWDFCHWTDQHLYLQNTSGNRFMFTSDGKFGVGQYAPTATIHAKMETPSLALEWTNTNQYGHFSFQEGATQIGVFQGLGSEFVTVARRYCLEFYSHGAGHIYMQGPAGNRKVGIGHLTVPAQRLDINGNIAMLGGVANTDRYIYFASDAYLFWDESEDAFIIPKDVGIGTNAMPGYPLTVQTADIAYVQIETTSALSGARSGIRFKNPTNEAILWRDGNDTGLYFYTSDYGNIMMINNDGGIFMYGLKAGANQAAAGAAANELWHDTDDHTVKLGV